MDIKVKLLRVDAKIPRKGTKEAAGYDLSACIDSPISVAPGQRVLIPTGLAFAIPYGYVMLIYPRSGLSLKQGITLINAVPVIDSDYRGEVSLIIQNHGQDKFVIEPRMRLAQAIIHRLVPTNYIQVNELEETERAEKGFGSTGIS